jgi:hypothetical protein
MPGGHINRLLQIGYVRQGLINGVEPLPRDKVKRCR